MVTFQERFWRIARSQNHEFPIVQNKLLGKWVQNISILQKCLHLMKVIFRELVLFQMSNSESYLFAVLYNLII